MNELDLVALGSAMSLEAIPGEGRTSDWLYILVSRVVWINMVQRVKGMKAKSSLYAPWRHGGLEA